VAAAKLAVSLSCSANQSAWFALPTVSGCPSWARHDADVIAPKLLGNSTALFPANAAGTSAVAQVCRRRHNEKAARVGGF
jgi:hypothetical protein